MSQRFLAVSISHRRAPVEVRERIALTEPEIKLLLKRLTESVCGEAMVLSTCNRTELYALPSSDGVSADYLIDFLLTAKELSQQETQSYKQYFERLIYCDAITHLFRVIAGIDSQIIGDQQIFAQVKDAFRLSSETESAGPFLTKLAHAAFRVAKRSISETSITMGAATVSYAAVEFARKIYDQFNDHHALIVGAGESAELAARYLIERNIGELSIVNRTAATAQEMLRRVRKDQPKPSDQVRDLTDLIPALSQADIIISSTAAREPIITKAAVLAAQQLRSSSYPQVFIDIAVPRDIHPDVGTISNVFLKDIDDLRSIVDQNLERRRLEIPKTEAIIAEELSNFLATLSKLKVGPTIKELRDKVEAIRLEELERQRSQFDPQTFRLVEEMTDRIMKRLMHSFMIALKEPQNSSDDLAARVELVRELFALDSHRQD